MKAVTENLGFQIKKFGELCMMQVNLWKFICKEFHVILISYSIFIPCVENEFWE
jgi:hypothetical protein